MTGTPSSTHRHRPAAGRIIRIGLAAAAMSAAVNSVLYLVAAAIGWFPRDVLTPAGQAITIGPVVIVSAAGALGAAVVLLLLSRFLERPLGAFLVISAVVLAILSIAPFGIEGAPPQMVATLEVMHLVVAVTAVGLLLRTARGA